MVGEEQPEPIWVFVRGLAKGHETKRFFVLKGTEGAEMVIREAKIQRLLPLTLANTLLGRARNCVVKGFLKKWNTTRKELLWILNHVPFGRLEEVDLV